MITRRDFVRDAALALPALRLPSASVPTFKTANAAWQATYDKALSILAGNVRVLPRYPQPVLIEGAEYAGVWMECGPLESLVYRKFRPDVARNTHMTFFALQREDGQFPSNNKLTEAGFGQIQMVVPIAATAWELAQATGDDELLRAAYKACGAWDEWLTRYRNTRGTGLTEGFCTYDTGMDNSPRWAGIPNRCPDSDARRSPQIRTMPRLCPDLSATTYGARRALAAMAFALGKSGEAADWTERADTMRGLILKTLYSAEDAAFYDLNAQQQFVRINTCILTRVCGEHVIDQALFDELWTRQLHNPAAFWAPVPFPSVALNDPLFVRPIPRNSWGGAAQALTALRTGRWFDHYGRAADHSIMMDRWCAALERDGTFRQQLDPLTGEFTQAASANYSPACLVMLDFTWRLAGVVEEAETLSWNVRPGHAAVDHASFTLPLDRGGRAEMHYVAGGATLRLAGRPLAQLTGTARLVTDKQGSLRSLLGIHTQRQHVTLMMVGERPRHFTIGPDEHVLLS